MLGLEHVHFLSLALELSSQIVALGMTLIELTLQAVDTLFQLRETAWLRVFSLRLRDRPRLRRLLGLDLLAEP